MVTLERKRLIWHDKLVLYPDADQVRHLAGHLGAVELVRARQTAAEIPDLPHVVEQRSFLTSYVDLRPDEDELFAALHTTTRQLVRHGQKMADDLELEWNTDRARRDFFEVHSGFAALKATPRLTRRRFAEYIPVSDVTVLYHRGKPLCAHLLVLDAPGRRVRLTFSASAPRSGSEDKGDAKVVGLANRYLHWRELVRYGQEGFHLYDFGGIGSGAGPLATFKQSFGGFPRKEYDYLLASNAAQVPFRVVQDLSRRRRRLRARVTRRRVAATP